METIIAPNKQGQVVKLVADQNPSDQYLVVDNFQGLLNDDLIKVCSISELQRATAAGRRPRIDYYKRDEITVLAEDFTSFIESFNN